MLNIYLRSALRSLRRNKTYSLLNVAGLAAGMAACIVILLFVFYENSFDRMHHRNLYRLNVVQKFSSTGMAEKGVTTAYSMAPALKARFPEILHYCRVDPNGEYEMTYGEKRVFYPLTYFVDASFLGMLDFPLLEGDRLTALSKPNSIVLTRSAARELFGTADPIGKTVVHFGEDTLIFTVTGLLKDLPGNSQMQFDALQSLHTVVKPGWLNGRGDPGVITYLELAPHSKTAELEQQFQAYLKRQRAGDGSIQKDLFLLPLRDVHAHAADIDDETVNFQKFDQRYTDIFMDVGLLVLLIACINFMNLATAQSAEKGKDVGIRKTIGARRAQLGIQFLIESVLLALMALLLALGIVSLVLPYVDQFSGRDLSGVFSTHPGLVAEMFAGTILLGLLSGAYPAVYLSSFRPVKMLKGGGEPARGRIGFRNVLVVVQFSSAIFLTIVTMLAFRQLHFMETQDPGFDRDQVITIPLHGLTSRKYALLKSELSADPLVAAVTGAQDHLGGPLNTMGFGFWPGDAPMRVLFTPGIFVDPDYLSFYKIPVEAGGNFSQDTLGFRNEFIINETLAKKLLAAQPDKPMSWLIGKHFGGDTLGRIVGICKDFNFNSLHYKIEPLFLLDQGASAFSTLSVKINGRQARRAVASIESGWKKILPEYPFSYQFLDDHFRALYRTDSQVSQMVAIMAGLAILISCLGLFGLASFAAERRTKEIGIRKVLGASVRDVVLLLSRRQVGLVLISNFIAAPLAWLALHRWIQGYAYRVEISWWVFALAGFAALLIAVATVSFRTIRAALSNPVETLRTD